MKKAILVTIVLFVIVAVAVTLGLFYATHTLETAIHEGVEREVSRITGTEAAVESVKVDLFTGKGSLQDFTIANPEGFSSEHVLEVGSVEVVVDPWTVITNREEPVAVSQISVERAEFTFEMRHKASNVKLLKQFVKANKRDEGGSKRKVIIERFELKNSTVDLVLGGKRRTVRRSVKVPDIVLHDIGKASNGVLAGEAARQIFSAIAKELRSVAGRTPGPWMKLLKRVRDRRAGKVGKRGKRGKVGEGVVREKVRQRLRERLRERVSD